MFILSNDGSLITLLSFTDFSVGQLLTFKVIADDNGSPSLKTEVNISIIVMNVNSKVMRIHDMILCIYDYSQ
jgi:hypothetical protein